MAKKKTLKVTAKMAARYIKLMYAASKIDKFHCEGDLNCTFSLASLVMEDKGVEWVDWDFRVAEVYQLCKDLSNPYQKLNIVINQVDNDEGCDFEITVVSKFSPNYNVVHLQDGQPVEQTI